MVPLHLDGFCAHRQGPVLFPFCLQGSRFFSLLGPRQGLNRVARKGAGGRCRAARRRPWEPPQPAGSPPGHRGQPVKARPPPPLHPSTPPLFAATVCLGPAGPFSGWNLRAKEWGKKRYYWAAWPWVFFKTPTAKYMHPHLKIAANLFGGEIKCHRVSTLPK
jgi:hypothetical protein